MAKYKKGDVLITKAGSIFEIEKVIPDYIEGNIYGASKGIYKLKNHVSYTQLPIKYIDSSIHISHITPAGKVLFGNKGK